VATLHTGRAVAWVGPQARQASVASTARVVGTAKTRTPRASIAATRAALVCRSSRSMRTRATASWDPPARLAEGWLAPARATSARDGHLADGAHSHPAASTSISSCTSRRAVGLRSRRGLASCATATDAPALEVAQR